MTEKKWKPVDELCANDLSERIVPLKILSWAEIYAAGGIVPPQNIPKLVRLFRHALVKLAGMPFEASHSMIEETAASAIFNLETQLAEHRAREHRKHPPEQCPNCCGKLSKEIQSDNMLEESWDKHNEGHLRCEGEGKCQTRFIFCLGRLTALHE